MMDTTHAIVEVEAEYSTLLRDPRRPLGRFVEVSLVYGRMLAEPDPHRSAEVLSVAVGTLRNPPAPAEARLAIELLHTMGPVAARLGLAPLELDAISRERNLLDAGLISPEPARREELCRRAAAVRFADDEIADGFQELIDGLRGCSGAGLEELASDLVLAVRRHHVPPQLMAELEDLWIQLRRQRFDGSWPVWCLTALGSLRLDAGDVITAQMYVRRAESILGHVQRAVAAALVGGWVALAANDFPRAFDRFTFASNAQSPDERVRLLAAAGLGESLVCLDRADEARAPLAEAIAYDVGDPLTVARCHELLSEIAMADGRAVDAYEHLQATRRLEQVARGEVPAVARVPHEQTVAAAAPQPPIVAVPAAVAVPATVVVPPASVVDSPEVDSPEADVAAPAAVEPPAIVDLREPTRHINLELPAPPAPLTGDDLVRQALAGGWLRLHYQAIYDNETGAPGAAEAFVRIEHPNHGTLAPADVLGDLDDAALDHALAVWTVNEACDQIARWSSAGTPFAVMVNLSRSQLTAALLEVVGAALTRSGARPRLLTIELDGPIADSLGANDVALVNDIRAMGVRIAIDKFGDQLRSIDTLLRLPVDVVKLDASIFAGSVLQPLMRRMVDTVVALSRTFGFDVIATGIETPAQLELQLDFGCEGVQGSFLGRPVDAATFSDRLVGVPASGRAREIA